MSEEKPWFRYNEQYEQSFGIRLPERTDGTSPLDVPLNDLFAYPRDWQSGDRQKRAPERVALSDEKKKSKLKAEGFVVMDMPPGAKTSWCSANRHVLTTAPGHKYSVREKIEELLSHRTFTIYYDTAVAKASCPVRVIVDPPVRKKEIGAIYRACGFNAGMKQDTVALSSFALLTETSKMGCFSFNMPAGPPSMHGTCPGAMLGFFWETGRELLKNQRSKVDENIVVDPASFICNACVTGDTMVRLRDGYDICFVDRTVRELFNGPKEEGEVLTSGALIRAGFKVWSGNAWRDAKVWRTGVKPVIEIRASLTDWQGKKELSKICLTADHLLMTETGSWIAAGKVSRGFRLAAHSSVKRDKEDVWVVDSVEPRADEEVFDLSVEEDHCFWANGFIAHNCYAAKGNYGNPSNILQMQARLMLVRYLLDREAGRQRSTGKTPSAVYFLDEKMSVTVKRGGTIQEIPTRAVSAGVRPVARGELSFADLMVYAIVESEKRSAVRLDALQRFGYSSEEFVEAEAYAREKWGEAQRKKEAARARKAEGSEKKRPMPVRVVEEHELAANPPRRRKSTKKKQIYGWEVPEPGYFRIHDAGDCWQDRVLESWVMVARALPKVRFWMPTRTWVIHNRLPSDILRHVPANMCIRPSAVHFREPPPSIVDLRRLGFPITSAWQESKTGGLSAGSGSTIGVVPRGGWECPAYRHWNSGGGALMLASEVKSTKQKEETAGVGGTCILARGKDGEGGCRVCWGGRGARGTNYSLTPVYYHEH